PARSPAGLPDRLRARARLLDGGTGILAGARAPTQPLAARGPGDLLPPSRHALPPPLRPHRPPGLWPCARRRRARAPDRGARLRPRTDAVDARSSLDGLPPRLPRAHLR